MKARITTLVATALLLLAPATIAADQPQSNEKKEKKEKPAACCEACKDECKCEKDACKCADKEKRVVLTGSHIPQKVTRHGRITTGVSPVVVLTADDLARTGETNVSAALRKLVPSMY